MAPENKLDKSKMVVVEGSYAVAHAVKGLQTKCHLSIPDHTTDPYCRGSLTIHGRR